MEKFYEYINKNQEELIIKLGEIVEIPSISGDAERRGEVIRMGEWLIEEMKNLGIKVKRIEPGFQKIEEKELLLPPIILGKLGKDENKKTVLIYAHYDVQPASKSDGWQDEPFKFKVDKAKRRMLGRGATDDKGPLLGWLIVVRAYKELKMELPVNLLFCFEGMEESGSQGLDEIIIKEANGWFAKTDCVCISDNYWLGKSKPCLTYGLRGISSFSVIVQGPNADLHSGVFGGTIHEPMTDLIAVLSQLVKPNGEILIPGIMDDVASFEEKEKLAYEGLSFTHDDLFSAIGAPIQIHDNLSMTLMHRWRYPSLSLHGIEGAYYGPGEKTVIPSKVIGKFSLRTVPNMHPDKVEQLVIEYLRKKFYELKTKNTIQIKCTGSGKPWLSNFDHWNFVAGSNAIKKVFGMKPDLTREGGSIPVTLTFEEALHKNVLLLPMGACDDGAHSINEKLDIRNYIEGIKVFGTYLNEVSLS